MRSRPVLARCLIALSAVMLGACAHSGSPWDDARALSHADALTMRASEGLPHASSRHPFVHQSPDARRLIRDATIHPGSHARVAVVDADTAEILRETEFALDPGGPISITRHAADGIDSAFDPPALFLPASLAPGQTVTATFRVTSTGERIPDGSGSGTSTITHAGADTRTIAGTPRACHVIDTATTFAIGSARVRIDRRAWFDAEGAGLGVLAEESRTRVRVFGFTVHDSSYSATLASLTPHEGTDAQAR